MIAMNKEFLEAFREAWKSRVGGRFMARVWDDESRIWDCVTFFMSVYYDCGVIHQGYQLPDYRVFDRRGKMWDVLQFSVSNSGFFKPVEYDALAEGDLILFSLGNRGHHCAIYVGEGRMVHCIRGRGVVVDSLVNPYVDNIRRVFRPLMSNDNVT